MANVVGVLQLAHAIERLTKRLHVQFQRISILVPNVAPTVRQNRIVPNVPLLPLVVHGTMNFKNVFLLCNLLLSIAVLLTAREPTVPLPHTLVKAHVVAAQAPHTMKAQG
jgi:hypothetical protein